MLLHEGGEKNIKKEEKIDGKKTEEDKKEARNPMNVYFHSTLYCLHSFYHHVGGHRPLPH